MTVTVDISLSDILHDGPIPSKRNTVQAGGQIAYELMADAQRALYSFQEANPSQAVDSITSLTDGVSNQQAAAWLIATPPAISGPGDSVLTLTVAGAATACAIEFNIKIRLPGGGYKEFDPIIDVVPR